MHRKFDIACSKSEPKLDNHIPNSLVFSKVEIQSSQSQEPRAYTSRSKRSFSKGAMLIGLLMSALSVISLTLADFQVKILSNSSPYLSNADIVFPMGISLIFFGLTIGFLSGKLLEFTTYPILVLVIILIRGLCGLINYILFLYVLDHLPLSKAVFMFSQNPIPCAILASIFLKEKLTKMHILCLVGAGFGIYLLSLNKEDRQAEGSVSGYLVCLVAVWIGGAEFVMTRYLNLKGAGPEWICITCGIGFVASALVAEELGFEKYTEFDWFMVESHGFLAGFYILGSILATKYIGASFVAPVINFENIFTICLDIFFFKYHFVYTDILGMVILALCIAVPVYINLNTNDDALEPLLCTSQNKKSKHHTCAS
ncbi:unnamed protein product [Moneuplotes crassus]|uniref:EamA domain-containing protein n=1 Tax=Euplotes crassus TaxID=5936 RepID=A0AAD1UMH1_EUPCR|nr:unnamed protein product [Moneuplotes crassus]